MMIITHSGTHRGLIGRIARLAFFISALCLTEAGPAAFAAQAGDEIKTPSHLQEERKAPETLPETVEVRADTDLFLRAEPSPEADKLAVVHAGESVTVLATLPESSWLRVSFSRAGAPLEGYLNGSYLKAWIMDKDRRRTADSGESRAQAGSEEDLREAGRQDGQRETGSEGEGPAGKEDQGLEIPVLPPEGLSEVRQVIWIGDSRIVGMSMAVSEDTYVAQESAGIEWLQEKGTWDLYGYLFDPAAGGAVTAVFALGINDLSNIQAYIACYRDWMEEWPDLDMVLLSVGPVDEAAEARNGYAVSNAAIEDFNDALAEAFPQQYLDVYGYLFLEGFESGDGVHYSADTYRGWNAYVHQELLERAKDKR